MAQRHALTRGYAFRLACVPEAQGSRPGGHYRTCAVSVPASGVGTNRQRLQVQLESVTPTTFFVADGVAADHPFPARIEAARKIIGNHEKVPLPTPFESPAAPSPPLPCPEATTLMAPFPQRHTSPASPSLSP